MNGPQHFREAERLLDQANGYDHSDATVVVAAAQVHATLALAGAAALNDAAEGMHGVDYAAWDEAAGLPLAEKDAS